MLKIFIAALLAIAMSAGSTHARVAGSANPHKYFPRCAEGMTSAKCICHASGATGYGQLCRAGQYCHTFDGVCRQ